MDEWYFVKGRGRIGRVVLHLGNFIIVRYEDKEENFLENRLEALSALTGREFYSSINDAKDTIL